MTPQTWEYRVVYLRNEEEALTHLGAEGWELVAVLDWPAPYSAKAYLKRLSVALPTEEQIDAREAAQP